MSGTYWAPQHDDYSSNKYKPIQICFHVPFRIHIPLAYPLWVHFFLLCNLDDYFGGPVFLKAPRAIVSFVSFFRCGFWEEVVCNALVGKNVEFCAKAARDWLGGTSFLISILPIIHGKFIASSFARPLDSGHALEKHSIFLPSSLCVALASACKFESISMKDNHPPLAIMLRCAPFQTFSICAGAWPLSQILVYSCCKILLSVLYRFTSSKTNWAASRICMTIKVSWVFV